TNLVGLDDRILVRKVSHLIEKAAKRRAGKGAALEGHEIALQVPLEIEILGGAHDVGGVAVDELDQVIQPALAQWPDHAVVEEKQDFGRPKLWFGLEQVSPGGKVVAFIFTDIA